MAEKNPVSLHIITDAISGVEHAMRKRGVVNPTHVQFLASLRGMVEAFCLAQEQAGDCTDYCEFLPEPSIRALGRARAGEEAGGKKKRNK